MRSDIYWTVRGWFCNVPWRLYGPFPTQDAARDAYDPGWRYIK